MNLCGGTLREINMFMEYFFSSDLENTFYSEIEKENLAQFRWAEGTQTQNEIPLFFTRSWEMARFSIVQHNFPFSWSICMELSIFSETRLQIRQWMILFLQNSDVRTLYITVMSFRTNSCWRLEWRSHQLANVRPARPLVELYTHTKEV